MSWDYFPLSAGDDLTLVDRHVELWQAFRQRQVMLNMIRDVGTPIPDAYPQVGDYPFLTYGLPSPYFYNTDWKNGSTAWSLGMMAGWIDDLYRWSWNGYDNPWFCNADGSELPTMEPMDSEYAGELMQAIYTNLSRMVAVPWWLRLNAKKFSFRRCYISTPQQTSAALAKSYYEANYQSLTTSIEREQDWLGFFGTVMAGDYYPYVGKYWVSGHPYRVKLPAGLNADVKIFGTPVTPTEGELNAFNAQGSTVTQGVYGLIHTFTNVGTTYTDWWRPPNASSSLHVYYGYEPQNGATKFVFDFTNYIIH